MRRMRSLFLSSLFLVAATPGAGQIAERPEPSPPKMPSIQSGHVADSTVGRVGQRQTRQEVAPNVQPLARISGRINNRVQSRIRNRIDRNYSPQANATSPFEVAADRARAGRSPRR
jgi:RecJ-like exonuclease